jgi:sialate O-acetylesterase
MIRRAITVLLTLGTIARAQATGANGDALRLPHVLSSHMVLQQQTDVAIWGFGAPNENVTVQGSWSTDVASTKADGAGRWRTQLHTPVAGGPYTIDVKGDVKGAASSLHLDDVLIGEVWLCGGQSNMEWAFSNGGVLNGEAERAAASDPQVRLFDAPNVVASSPQSDCDAEWSPATPESVNGFSCVGWFFARELRKALNVPVGLIGVNWGGTVAQAWVRREALAPFPRFKEEIAWVDSEASDPAASRRRAESAYADWFKQLDAKDHGVRDGWAGAGFDDSAWETQAVPGMWRDALQSFDGIVWYRRSIDLPPELAGKELELSLGAIDDMDTVWLDGTKVGGTEVTGRWTQPRSYRIPAKLATAGRHELAIRIVDTGGDGGVAGAPEDQVIRVPGTTSPPSSIVSLAGDWKRHASTAASEFPQAPQVRQLHANVATVLWNGLVAPIVPFGIRGALWYQGESNRGNGAEYADLMPALITDWRARFERPDFPFYFVQIAPFDYGDKSGVASGELREAQLQTLRVKNTGMVVTTDIGDRGNIHPQNKQEVGRRLSLWALSKTYGKDVGEVSGPLLESMQPEGSKVRVKFTHTTGGLVAKGGPLAGFEVRAADGAWTPAKATIDGDTVLVFADSVATPTEVRFGFADVCENNLFNGAGLPASPFCRIERAPAH